MEGAPGFEDIEAKKQSAEIIYTNEQVENAIDRMANEINEELKDAYPIILCVLLGGIVITGKLVTKLKFPCEISYIHVSRYRNKTQGGEINWLSDVYGSVQERDVVIVDDILDEGTTLLEIEKRIKQKGARRIYKAVLIKKNRSSGSVTNADFIGLEVPDRYVFGYGMDYKGHFRNISGIYAIT